MSRLNRFTLAALALMIAAIACAATRRVPPAAGTLTAEVSQMQPAVIASARQLVVVTTPDWNSTTGSLRRFTRESATSPWKKASTPIPVVVGRTGLAWGLGFDATATAAKGDPHKHDGDGRSSVEADRQ